MENLNLFKLVNFKTPISVIIENTSNEDVKNVDIGESYFNRTHKNYGNPDSIKITSLIKNFSYKRMLSHSEASPQKTLSITLTSSEKENLFNNNFYYNIKDSNGKQSMSGFMAFNDYKNKSESTTAILGTFIVGGFSRFRLGKIKANSKIELNMSEDDFTNVAEINIAESTPWLISIKNNGDEIVDDIVFGWGYEKRDVTNFGNKEDISVSVINDGITYVEFLAQTEACPLKVMSTTFVFSSEEQQNNSIKLTNGINEYLFKSDEKDLKDNVVKDHYEYEFNGDCRFEIGKLLPNQEIIVRIGVMRNE